MGQNVCILGKKGEYSLYYDFYERDRIGNDNGMGHNLHLSGYYTYYSNWYSLPNVDLSKSSTIAREYFLDVAKYWITEFDIDGYRCDAAWGPEYRYGDYWQDWRKEVKKKKPEVLLLAEAPATNFVFFDKRFDLAYDWDFSGNIGNDVDNKNINNIHNQIINEGYYFPETGYPFRFLENHDEDRFYAVRGAAKTKMAAALLLTIPGVPLLYAGQEVGEITQRETISWDDPDSLKDYYKKLIAARTGNPAFYSSEYERISNSHYTRVFSYIRTTDESEDQGLVALNFSNTVTNAVLYVPDLGLEDGKAYYANEMITETAQLVQKTSLDSFEVHLEPYEAKVFVISENKITHISDENHIADKNPLPTEYKLFQNYPNPFNSSTNITFSLKEESNVDLKIFSITGQKVKTLVSGLKRAGEHVYNWDGTSDTGINVSSGIYLCSINTGNFSKTIKLIYLK